MVQVAAAGVAGAAGEHTGGVDLDRGLAHPGRGVVPIHGVGAVQVEDRADGDAGQVGPPEPGREQAAGRRTQPLDLPAGPGRVGQVGGRQVHEQLDPPAAAGRLAEDPGLEQVQRPLRVGEHADRLGPADLEAVGVPEPAQAGGEVGQGVVEVQGVEGVQAHVDLGGGRAAVVDQGDMAGGQGGLLIGGRPVRVVVQDRLLDDPADPEHGQVLGVAGQHLVHPGRHLEGQAAWSGRRPAGPATRARCRPGPGRTAGAAGAAAPARRRSAAGRRRGRSPGVRPARPARTPRPAGSLPRPTGPGPRRAGRPHPTRPAAPLRGDRVQVGPLRRDHQQLGRRGQLRAAGGTGPVQHRAGAGPGLQPGLDRDLEHVFESSRWPPTVTSPNTGSVENQRSRQGRPPESGWSAPEHRRPAPAGAG